MSTPHVTLQEIDATTVRAVVALDVAPDQKGLVAPNAVSIAEAYFEPKAWFRAIYADGAPAGFVMVFRDPPAEFFLWRLMVDCRFQGRGVGRRALELTIEEARSDGMTAIVTSVVPTEGSAQVFYEKLGFVATGEMDEGEAVMRLDLTAPPRT